MLNHRYTDCFGFHVHYFLPLFLKKLKLKVKTKTRQCKVYADTGTTGKRIEPKIIPDIWGNVSQAIDTLSLLSVLVFIREKNARGTLLSWLVR